MASHGERSRGREAGLYPRFLFGRRANGKLAQPEWLFRSRFRLPFRPHVGNRLKKTLIKVARLRASDPPLHVHFHEHEEGIVKAGTLAQDCNGSELRRPHHHCDDG